MSLRNRLFAEAAGTAFLVLVGCGAIAASAARPAPVFVVPLAFTVAVAVPVLLLGPVSGAHLNPAVTLALAARRRLPWRDVLPYLSAQCAGAFAAALVLRVSVGAGADIGATTVRDDISLPAAFLAEAAATAVLLLVILVAATGPRLPVALQALAIGGTVGLAAWLIGPLTRASLNPARSLGPALLSGPPDATLLLYLAAPVVGAVAGASLACALLPRRLCCVPLVPVPPPPEVAA